MRLGAAVVRIAHGGPRVRLELADGGAVEAEAAVVTLPTSLLARESVRFDPPLPDKTAAAAALPLGCAGKVFLHLDGAERDFAPEKPALRLDHDHAHGELPHPPLRPARDRELLRRSDGRGAGGGPGRTPAADVCIGLIADALGSAVRRRLRPLAVTDWSVDPWSRGAYSHALPGHVDDRDVLARPEERLVFAGEACSRTAYSSAHGAYETGVAAAEAALVLLGAER